MVNNDAHHGTVASAGNLDRGPFPPRRRAVQLLRLPLEAGLPPAGNWPQEQPPTALPMVGVELLASLWPDTGEGQLPTLENARV